MILAGVHAGCFELFATERIRGNSRSQGQDRGRARTGIVAPCSSCPAMAAHVGLDPTPGHQLGHEPSPAQSMELFADGKIDAFLGFPPEPQELARPQDRPCGRQQRHDRPWSQYFCCMLAGNRDFVRKNPVATKRVLRAILKADRSLRQRARHVAHAWSMADLRLPIRLCAPDAERGPATTSGGSTTPRTRSGSMRCGCARRA